MMTTETEQIKKAAYKALNKKRNILAPASYRNRIDSAYLRGWDDAVIYKKANPYFRRDFHDAYERGWTRCNAGEALPDRFSPYGKQPANQP